MTALLEAALQYAALGWHVFPVADDTKKPITPHGYLDATVDSEQINWWWAAHPDARIGLALRPSGLIAIDYDVGPGKEEGSYKTGDRTLAAVEAKHGTLPREWHQRSQRGGGHIVMLDPSPGPEGWTRTQSTGGRCRGNLDFLGLGLDVDVKCNGYILVEPSGSYKWLSSLVDASGKPVVPTVPAAWVGVLQKPPSALSVGDVTVEAWRDSAGLIEPDEVEVMRARLKELVRSHGAPSGRTFAAIKTIFHEYGCGLNDGVRYLCEWNDQPGAIPHDDVELARQVERIAEQPNEGLRGHRLRSVQAIVDEGFEELKPKPPSPEHPGVLLADVDHIPQPPVRRYKTGLPELDAKLGGGISTRQLAVILAPPGDGKSALAVSVSIFMQSTIPVLYASTELETHELEARVAAQIIGCAWRDIVDGKIDRARVAEVVRGLRIVVIGCERLPMGEAALQAIDAEVARVAALYGVPPLVVIDYLQDLARGVDERGVRAKIGGLATVIRAMSQRLDCPMLVISSVSRSYYGMKRAQEMRQADDATVYLAAAKESGDVDYAAAVVMFLDVVGAAPGTGYRCARIAVAKSRHGETGFVGARFTGATGRWQAAPDEVLEAAGKREAVIKASETEQDDMRVLAAVQQAAREQRFYTPKRWRDDGLIAELSGNAVREALARLVRDGGPLVLQRMNPATLANAPGGGEYVVLRTA